MLEFCRNWPKTQRLAKHGIGENPVNSLQSLLVYTIQRNPENRIMQNGGPWNGSVANCASYPGIHPKRRDYDAKDTSNPVPPDNSHLCRKPSPQVRHYACQLKTLTPNSSSEVGLAVRPRLSIQGQHYFSTFHKRMFILRGRGFTFTSSRRGRHLARHRRHIPLSLSPS